MSNRFPELFRKKTPGHVKTPTIPVPSKYDFMNPTGRSMIQPPQVRVGSGQSTGLQRGHNEDALYTFSSVLSDGEMAELFGLFIIADGMGGHQNGEIASSVSVRVVVRYILNHFYGTLFDPLPGSLSVDFQEILIGAVNEAQKAVLHYAAGGGTTIIIALMLGDKVTICHVGDSRAYFVLSDGRLQRITKDHSLVQRLLDLDEITESEAEVHPQKNVLLRAVGQPEPYVPDVQTLPLPEGAQLMLCSDGLWGVVDETEIRDIIIKQQDPILSCQRLVDAANREGGPDNISVILVRRTDKN